MDPAHAQPPNGSCKAPQVDLTEGAANDVLAARRATPLVIDLSQVKAMDSAGVAALVYGWRLSQARLVVGPTSAGAEQARDAQGPERSHEAARERVAMAEKLLQSVEAEGYHEEEDGIQAAWAEEIQRRSRELRDATVKGLSVEEAHRIVASDPSDDKR